MRQLRSQIELGYIAGTLDSEGTLAIHRNKNSYHAYVVVGQTDYSWLQGLKETWGGVVYKGRGLNENRPHWAILWRWVLTGDKMVALLETVKPFLRLKKTQAELLLEFQAGVQKSSSPLSQAEVERRRGLYNRCRTLNCKGPRSNQLLLAIDSAKLQYELPL